MTNPKEIKVVKPYEYELQDTIETLYADGWKLLTMTSIVRVGTIERYSQFVCVFERAVDELQTADTAGT